MKKTLIYLVVMLIAFNLNAQHIKKKIDTDLISIKLEQMDVQKEDNNSLDLEMLYSIDANTYSQFRISKNTNDIIDRVNTAKSEDILFFTSFEYADTSKFRILDMNNDDISWKIIESDNFPGVKGASDPFLFYATNRQAPANDFVVNNKALSLESGEYHMSVYYRSRTSHYAESLGFYMGKDKSATNLETLHRLPTILNDDWQLININFTIEENDDYFFYIKAESGRGLPGIGVDEWTITKGKYLDRSILKLEYVALPARGCNLSSEVTIGAKLTNVGSLNTSTVKMKYSVNGGNIVEETFDTVLRIGESLYLEFAQTVDMSQLGEYNVEVTAIGDDNLSQVATAMESTKNIEAVSIPYKTNFASNIEDRLDWTSSEFGTWTFSDENNAYEQDEGTAYLISKCFNMQAVEHRIAIDFKVGLSANNGTILLRGGFDVLIGSPGADIETFDNIGRVYGIYMDESTLELVFDIEVAGEYVIVISSIEYDVTIFDIGIVELKNIDLALNSVQHTIPLSVPLGHIKNIAQPIIADVENKGLNNLVDAVVRVKQDGTILATSNKLNINKGEKKEFELDFIVKSPIANTDIIIDIETFSSEEDENIIDNSKKLVINISDSTLKFDSTTSFSNGIGTKTLSSFGIAYNLKVQDTLTSVDIGFATVPMLANTEFLFSIYQINKDVESYIKGEKIYSNIFQRGIGGEFKTFKLLVPIILAQGEYMFAVEQLTAQNIGVAIDKAPKGVIYLFDESTTKLQVKTDYGYMAFRLNFAEVPDFTPQSVIGIKHITLPPAGCELSKTSEISVDFTNIGNGESSEVKIGYKLNDEEWVEELYSVDLSLNKLVSVKFNDKLDLSAVQEHIIKVYVVGSDEKSIADTAVASVRNIKPLSTPYITDFADSLGIAVNDWTSVVPGNWIFRDNFEAYTTMGHTTPLKSNCFRFADTGKYRVAFEYTCGYVFFINNNGGAYLTMGKVGQDIAEFDTLLTVEGLILERTKIDTLINITDINEDYVFAFIPMKKSADIYEVSIIKEATYDLCLNSVSMDAYRKIPISHIENVGRNLKAEIRNIGSTVQYAGIDVKHDNVVILSSTKTEIESNEISEISLDIILNDIEVNDDIELVVSAVSDTIDNNLLDNTESIFFGISDTTLVFDNATTFTVDNGVGAGTELGFGMIYDLPVLDTVTSVDIAFAQSDNSYIDMPFLFSIYEVEETEDGLVKGNKRSTVELERGIGGSFANYSFDAIILDANKYMFAVEQIMPINIGIVTDKVTDGMVYLFENTSTQLTEDNRFGYLAVRPCFGYNAKIVEVDASIKEITKPSRFGVFAINQNIQAVVTNYGNLLLEDVEVVLNVNGKTSNKTIESIRPYEEITIAFESDLSEVGKHELLIFTNVANDENRKNDTVVKVVECVDAGNPYIMNFEGCEDFSIDNFEPAWLSIDYDGALSGGFTGVNFQNQDVAFGFIVFNPSQVFDDFTGVEPYSGDKYGMSSYSSLEGEKVKSNDWIISPKLKLGKESKFEFYRKCSDVAYPEIYNVLVSTKGTDRDDFVIIEENAVVSETTWKKEIVDLSEYNNQEVHVAIQCISYDKFMFMVDDLEVVTNLDGVDNQLIGENSGCILYPNPARDIVQIRGNGAIIKNLTIYNLMGLQIFTSPSNLNLENIVVDINNFEPGIYFVKIKTAQGYSILKLIVN